LKEYVEIGEEKLKEFEDKWDGYFDEFNRDALTKMEEL